MNAGKWLMGSALVIACWGGAVAETYKCAQNGKTVISDAPCAHNASRVDQQHDKVDRSQQRQAESTHIRNSTQLNELESKARYDRSIPGGVQIVPGPASPADTPRRSY